MTQSDDATADAPNTESADTAWAESLREVICKVIATLPDDATLGELVEAGSDVVFDGRVGKGVRVGLMGD